VTESCAASADGGVGPMFVGPPPGTRDRKRILRKLRWLRKQSLRQGTNTDRSPDATSCVVPPEPVSPLRGIEDATGLSLPDDARTVLGDRMVVAFGGLHLGALPDVALRTHPGDLEDAAGVVGRLQSRLGADGGPQLASRVSGDDLVLATSDDYAGAVAGDAAGRKDLAADERFGLAMGSVPDAVVTAGYVDLSRIWPLLGATGSDAEHLAAVGFWTGRDGHAEVSQVRFVAG